MLNASYSLSLYLSISPLHFSASGDCADTSYKRQNPKQNKCTPGKLTLSHCGFNSYESYKFWSSPFFPHPDWKNENCRLCMTVSININESSCWGKPDMRSGYSQDALQILQLSIFHFKHSMDSRMSWTPQFIFQNATKCLSSQMLNWYHDLWHKNANKCLDKVH